MTAPTTTTSAFADAFGTDRGDTGMRDLRAGRDTAAAERAIKALQLNEDYATMLTVLREAGEKASAAPFTALSMIVGLRANRIATSDAWQARCIRFFKDTGITDPTMGPEFLLYLEDHDQLALYSTSKAAGVEGGLRTGIGHLRTVEDIDSWLVSFGVQTALEQVFLDTMRGPRGEDTLRRHLRKESYDSMTAEAKTAGASTLREVLDDDDELLEEVRELLPSNATEVPSFETLKWFGINGYRRAIARGIDRRSRATSPST